MFHSLLSIVLLWYIIYDKKVHFLIYLFGQVMLLGS